MRIRTKRHEIMISPGMRHHDFFAYDVFDFPSKYQMRGIFLLYFMTQQRKWRWHIPHLFCAPSLESFLPPGLSVGVLLGRHSKWRRQSNQIPRLRAFSLCLTSRVGSTYLLLHDTDQWNIFLLLRAEIMPDRENCSEVSRLRRCLVFGQAPVSVSE